MKQLKDGDVYPCMGCRSFLTVDRFSKNKGNISESLNFSTNSNKYYGRFNQGVVTINLVDVALSSNKNMDDFWTIFDERLELCHKALRIRHERLLGTSADVAPILWRYGAIARLKKGEKIDIMYAELNTKSDYCQVCGYDGEIKLIDENNSLIWECPNCGNRDQSKMNVARRTCGYIGTNFWNKGRTQEIAERYVHLDDHSQEE